jgi:hypothetical protein
MFAPCIALWHGPVTDPQEVLFPTVAAGEGLAPVRRLSRYIVDMNQDCSGGEGGGEIAAAEKQLAMEKMLHVLTTMRRMCMTSQKENALLYPAGTLVHLLGRREWEAALHSCVLAPSLSITERNPLCLPFRVSCASGGEHCALPSGQSVFLISSTEAHVAYVADQRTFAELQLSGAMFSDHLPQHYMRMLRELFPSSS